MKRCKTGNDESDPLWKRMIDLTDQLVVATTTTRDEHPEAGALLLEALADRDDRSVALADGLLCYDGLRKPTEQAWLRAAAATARGL